MAGVGTDAQEQGYPLVPDTGEEGRVRWGAREINRTRDFIAQIKVLISITKAAWRDKVGITSDTTDPDDADGADGDIYFKTLP